MRLQEAAVESGNSILSAEDRSLFRSPTLKSEMLNFANKSDSFGNALFGGVSVVINHSENSDGTVNYLDQQSQEVKISNGLSVGKILLDLRFFSK